MEIENTGKNVISPCVLYILYIGVAGLQDRAWGVGVGAGVEEDEKALKLKS